ncbi:GGDEF domain-containing protein [Allochromatium palmeri]|uniref:diguanylate cyclase n=1 Tax=Allochromatium palmeri TaxID=231048 RepID=A0A6N8EL70_9GAMM|nr:diguanylate cyclase [Allochromatium palmeri]MTW23064.1 diguanylate cyclase [Allochromatium palmeri]
MSPITPTNATATETKAIEQAFQRYLDVYFTQRDLAATLALLSPAITGFGTGRDETAMTFAMVSQLYRRDIEQAPNPIAYHLRHPPHIQFLFPNRGLVNAELDLHTMVLDQAVSFYHLRLSLVFIRQDSDWLIEHMHLSLPTQVHGEDEAYPLKELEARNQVLERLVNKKTQELQQALSEIARIATTDPLTGLSNRLRIDEYLDAAIQRAQDAAYSLSLILLDLDHFKHINDTYGHLQGDRVLIELSALLSATIRPTDLLGRWGGEEFIVICPGMTLDAAVERAEQLCAAVRAQALAGLEQPQTASLGVASYRVGESLDDLIARVDAALYRAKLDGRNRVVQAL